MSKLNVSEALGALELAVFDDTDTSDVTSLEKFSHGLARGVVREITQVGGVGRLVGERLREVALANRVS